MKIVYREEIPLKTVSEGNSREFWGKAYARHRKQKNAVFAVCRSELMQIQPPCYVMLTRRSPRKFDDDNLVSALKYVRDAVAEILVPGLAVGRADDGHGLTWYYKQEKGKTAVIIEVLQ